MKKMANKFLDVPNAAILPALAITAALFLCGAVAGCVTATYIPDSADSALTDYLSEYIFSVSAGLPAVISLRDAFFNAFKYHTVIFILGFTALGALLIPFTAAIRGFFLSFAISASVKMLGYKGLLLAAGIFGLPCLFTLPCLFIISSQAVFSSGSLLSLALRRERKNHEPIYGHSYFIKAVFCALILSLCALFETFVSPFVVSAITSYIVI